MTKNKSKKFLILAALMVMGAVWMCVSVRYGIWAKNMPGDGFFPFLMGFLMILVSLMDIGATWRAKPSQFHMIQFLPILGLALVLLAAKLVGTVPACGVYVLVWLKGFEKYSWKFSIMVSVMLVLFIFLVFDQFVAVNFESGLLGRMIGY